MILPICRIFLKVGYIAHFGISMGCAMAAVLYAAVFLKDSRNMRPKEALEEMEARKAMMADLQKGPEGGDAEEEANDNGGCARTPAACCSVFDLANVKRALKITFRLCMDESPLLVPS